jgi:tRNA1(Val) A37 N6-methylase TrmN6
MDALSIQLTKELTLIEKKKDGIYFTEPKAIIELLNKIPIKYKNVLEPSCGSGEFLKHISTTNITGIELNKYIYDKISKTYPYVKNMDFLNYHQYNKHDLIIGNPPYYMTTQKYDSPLLYGRLNIYILFIIHSMKLIMKNGVIAFIIPTNFMNSSYYNKIREEIYKNWKIINFIKYSDIFEDTKQTVFGLIIQNKKPINNDKFVYIKNNNYYFVFDITNLPKTESYKTLNDIDYKVGVGRIQWDKNKDLFITTKTDTVLIYSSDITKNGIELKNKNYRYLDNSLGLNEPLLILNRGYGNAKYSMNIALLDGSFRYQLENHVLYIKSKNGKYDINMLKKIKKSLENTKTNDFIENIFNNNAITCYELQNIIPLYI